jgi:O-antigen/teichoic acid export membrane protein
MIRPRLRPSTPAQRGFLTIIGGTAGGQLMGILISPVLSRVYSPADFGIFIVIFALSSTLGTIAALRFELAVPLAASEREAQSLATLGFVCSAVTAVVGSAFVAAFGEGIVSLLHRPELMPWLRFVPPMAALLAGFMVLNQLAVRHRRYAAIGRRSLWQSGVMVTTQTATGLAGLQPGGLMLGMAVGQAAGLLSLLPGAGLASPAGRQGRKWRSLKQALRDHRRFPLVLAPSGLINVLGIQLPVLILAYVYGSAVAGWLGLAQRVLGVPVTIVGTAIAQVYLGELAEIRRQGSPRAASLFDRTTRRLILASVPITLVLLLFGPAGFALVFGAPWRTSGEYAQALALGLAAQLVAAPLSQTLIAYQRPYLQLCWDIGRLVVAGGGVICCALAGASPLIAVWTLSMALVLSYVASWLLSRHVLHTVGRPGAGGIALPVRPRTTDV